MMHVGDYCYFFDRVSGWTADHMAVCSGFVFDIKTRWASHAIFDNGTERAIIPLHAIQMKDLVQSFIPRWHQFSVEDGTGTYSCDGWIG